MVKENNLSFSSQDGILFNKDKTELLYYPNGKKNETYNVPDSIKVISAEAFYQSTNLKSIKLSNGLTTIEDSAFAGCRKITNIEIPATVTNIDSYQDGDLFDIYFSPFIGCSNLREIIVDEENTVYSSLNGILFNKDKTEILCYPEGKEDVTYVIPNSVNKIGNYMFANSINLKKIIIPNLVTDLKGLALVKIPENKIVIGQSREKLDITLCCKKGSAAEQYALEHNIKYEIDDESPTINGITGIPTSWTNQDVTIEIDATDNLSGIANENAYSFDNGDTWQNSNSKTYSQNVEKINIQVKDNLGNIETFNQKVNIDKIDKISPKLTIIPNGANISNSQNIVINITEEGGSGLNNNNSYQYQLGISNVEVPNGDWKEYTNSEPFQIGEDLTGEYYLWIKTITDNAGNASSTEDYTVSNKFTINNEGDIPSNTEDDENILSSNNNLFRLFIDGIQISNFNKDKLEYTIETVENYKETIEITAEAEDENATVSGVGTKKLQIGENSFFITVTAEDGTQKKYQIKINRKEKNNANTITNITNIVKDDTQAPGILPQTGATLLLKILILIIVIIAIINFIEIKKIKVR